MDYKSALRLLKEKFRGHHVKRDPENNDQWGVFPDKGRGGVSADADSLSSAASKFQRKESLSSAVTNEPSESVFRETAVTPGQGSTEQPVNRKIQRLIVGLDFGTAFSKVIVSSGQVNHVVQLRNIGSYPDDYLLPTTLWVTSEGDYSISPIAGAEVYRDLKSRIFVDDVDEEAYLRIVAYLTLLLRKVRRWIQEEKHQLYGRSRLDWYINVGLPTRIHQHNKLEDKYKSLVTSAWLLAASSRPINRNNVIHVLEQSSIENGKSDEDKVLANKVRAFPEFVAQVTGYVRGPRRRRGLHVLTDIGAGTVDSTVFNVHQREYEDKYPIFSGDVTYSGVEVLVDTRLSAGTYKGSWKPDLDYPIPVRQDFAQKMQIPISDLEGAEKNLRAKVYKQLASGISEVKTSFAPMQEEWTTGVPLFITGGGSFIEFYNEVVAGLCENWRRQGVNLQIEQLPSPENLDAPSLNPRSFHRLSVAYGLSFSSLDIGEVMQAPRFSQQEGDLSTATRKCPVCNGTGGATLMGCLTCGGSGFIH
ncbi:MAG: hypothetical protein CL783_00250 [Chloroflexi bacterium]|nr:hypothetical protein [Chloroflexota bacterium]|tara:strand:- start:12185 stop:13777 length:1593 start_codon:yes stop_codon:yes gene_type:complete